MAPRLHNPLVPRHSLLLQVLGIARISGDKQDERSLEDQEALYRGWLDDFCDTPYELTMIAGEGSGERLDRDEWALAAQEVETCRYDLVFCEDLGRIVRRIHAFLFCELAEDHDTRVIALNDHVDTADENWRVCAVFASLRHEMHNDDTSKRIRRSLRNRFTNGGIVQFPIYGYIKPPGSSSDAELTKDSAATPILERWFTMLEEGASFAEVADMLNSLAVKPGQFCRKDTWDGNMVARVTRNPILKGYRIRNKFMTKRENRTGRRKSIKAPPGELLVRICPHLQHIEPERWDRLVEMLNERNGACRRRLVEGRDPRAQVPKKRTRFPGQTVFCGVCGRMYIFGGHHEVAYLICSGSTAYACWNGAPLHEVIALSLPACSEADEIAAMMLAQVLETNDCLVQAVSLTSLATEMVDLVERRKADIVCVSATPPAATMHARYLCKHLRRRFPKVKLVVGLWDVQGDLNKASERIGCGATVVATMADAQAHVRLLIQQLLPQTEQLTPPACGKVALLGAHS